MTENAKKFMEKVSADSALQAELEAAVKDVATAEQIPAVVAFAKNKGYGLTKEDFTPDDADLDLNELDGVVGAGLCACPVYGAGSGHGLFCRCVIGGTGGVNKKVRPDSQGGCICAAAGAGATNRH